ncbi:excalibur calcium-binding domain-containing protein [Nocardia sp. N2S4-5]|uniref:excalibur calcium-binding domain-containing protein n=1 Tax=Nocardia sp. N2S4-5 TaxID=3351565 RepID=UPI0037D35521
MSLSRTALAIAAVGLGFLTACSNTVTPNALPAESATSSTSAIPSAPEPTTLAPADGPLDTNAPAAEPPPPAAPPQPAAPPEPAPTTTPPPPAPKPTKPPAPTSTPKPYYKSCKEAKAAGATPLHKGDPGYRPGLDGDNNGIACEK